MMVLFYYNHLIGMRKKNVVTVELPKGIIIPQLILPLIFECFQEKRSVEANACIN
jgi:hypothetical protein